MSAICRDTLVVISHGVAHVIRLRSRAAPPARAARDSSESAARSALKTLLRHLRHVAPAAPPGHASHEGPQSVAPSRVVPSSSAVARPMARNSPIEVCGRCAGVA
jgi:hypothetical protein